MKNLYYRIVVGKKDLSLKQYIDALSQGYESKPIKLKMKNKWSNQFLIFPKSLKEQLREYHNTSNKVIKIRQKGNISPNYRIDEINSSLRIENVASSRKLLKKVLNSKSKKPPKNQVEKMAGNMNLAFDFIYSAHSIKPNQLYILYSIMTNDIDMKKAELKDNNWYRHDRVYIGGEQAMDFKQVPDAIEQLIEFIKSDSLNNMPIVKALVAHYVFEHIHPYFDYNGRTGRMLHLWTLLLIDQNEYDKNKTMSLAIEFYRDNFYKAFQLMQSARDYNVDLTLWVEHMLNIFIKFNKLLIKHDKILSNSKIKLNTQAKYYLLDIMKFNISNPESYITRESFKNLYPEYSATIGDRIHKQFQESGLFKIVAGKPKKYYLKQEYK